MVYFEKGTVNSSREFSKKTSQLLTTFLYILTLLYTLKLFPLFAAPNLSGQRSWRPLMRALCSLTLIIFV